MIAETKEHGDLEPYALFRYTTTGFMSGSDHYIYSDPSVGVPMPALASLPDKFYHTSADTPDKVDPLMLRRAGVLAAFYAAWIANAGREEVLWLSHEMQAYFSSTLAGTLQDQYGNSLEALDKYGVFALECHQRSLSTLCRLDETIKDHLPYLNEDAFRIFNYIPGTLWEQFQQKPPPVKQQHNQPVRVGGAGGRIHPAAVVPWSSLLRPFDSHASRSGSKNLVHHAG